MVREGEKHKDKEWGIKGEAIRWRRKKRRYDKEKKVERKGQNSY